MLYSALLAHARPTMFYIPLVCMSVTLWNAIITAGISVTLLMIASARATYVHVIKLQAMPRAYMYSMWNVERNWPDFEKEGREREMTEKHAVSKPGCISEGQSTRCLA